jgi:intraflagellar transport protein 56
LAAHPTSPLAVNLKACNTFKLADGKAAEQVLRSLADAGAGRALEEHALLRHNSCVFRGGEGALRVSDACCLGRALPSKSPSALLWVNACVFRAEVTLVSNRSRARIRLQVFPPLQDVCPEARLNLTIYHLRRGDVGAAYSLVRDVAPATPQEYILKAVVHALLGQREGSADHLQRAQAAFQVGFLGGEFTRGHLLMRLPFTRHNTSDLQSLPIPTLTLQLLNRTTSQPQ